MFRGLFVLSFAVASVAAFGAEQTQLPSNVIGQVRTFGGFGPPGMTGERGLRVFTDGTVVSFNRNVNPQQVTIARLSAQKLAEFRAAADQLRISRLTTLDDPRNPCMDAPSTEFAVNTSRAGALVINRVVGCIRYEDQAAYELVQALNGLRSLAQVGANR